MVLKPLLRFVIQSVLSNMAQHGGGVYTKSYTFNSKKPKKEGTIEVNQKSNTASHQSSEGEYIDFEEIK
jgi:hypothetical protein